MQLFRFNQSNFLKLDSFLGLAIFFIFSIATGYTISYYGDDSNVLQFASSFDFLGQVKTHLRPIELAIAWVSINFWEKFWFFSSVSLIALTAWVSAKTYAEIDGRLGNLFPFILLGCPLYALLISQIDAVSQCLGNLMAATSLYFFIKFRGGEKTRDYFWASICACLAILSKETFVFVLVFPMLASIVTRVKSGYTSKINTINITVGLLFLYFKANGTGIGSNLVSGGEVPRYAIKWNLMEWGFNFIFSLTSPLNIVPTSVMSLPGGRYVYVTVALALLVLAVFLRIKSKSKKVYSIEFRIILLMIGLLVLPLVLVKSAELYSTALYCPLLLLLFFILDKGVGQTLKPILPVMILVSSFNLLVLTGFKCSAAEGDYKINAYCKTYQDGFPLNSFNKSYSLYAPIDEPVYSGLVSYLIHMYPDKKENSEAL